MMTVIVRMTYPTILYLKKHYVATNNKTALNVQLCYTGLTTPVC